MRPQFSQSFYDKRYLSKVSNVKIFHNFHNFCNNLFKFNRVFKFLIQLFQCPFSLSFKFLNKILSEFVTRNEKLVNNRSK